MKIPSIPQKLDDWTIEVLDSLLDLRSIESDTFDFKGPKLNELENHICAMANTNGGYIVLGIEERKSDNYLLGYKKVGFEIGKENLINNQIADYLHKVEPSPNVHVKHLHDKQSFYVVLKVDSEISEKPYFIKEKWQVYIRVNSSTRLATRSEMLGLHKIIAAISNEDRRKHTLSLTNDVYKRLLDVKADLIVGRPAYDQKGKLMGYFLEQDEDPFHWELQIPEDYAHYHASIRTAEEYFQRERSQFISISKLEYLDWAIDHLKHNDYTAAYFLWNDSIKAVKALNQAVSSLINFLYEKVPITMKKEFPHLVDHIGPGYWEDFARDQFFTRNIVCSIMRRIYAVHIHKTENTLIPKFSMNHLAQIWTVFEERPILVDHDKKRISARKIGNVYFTLMRDSYVTNTINEIHKAQKTAEESMKPFTKELSVIVRELNGGDLLKGKCKIGY